MMWSNRPSVTAAVRKTRVCVCHARARKLARARSAQACDLRAIAAADGRSTPKQHPKQHPSIT
eukprot:8039088-Lingulodinium_polyedra.AAC.1